MFIYIVIFILAFVVLANSSNFLVRSLTGLARILRISEYAVAFIFMSMATSIPELFVGLSSALKGMPDFSLGNILGANLLNITLVIGLVIILGMGLRVESKISRRNFWMISAYAFLPLLMASDGVISRGDGMALLVLFVFYMLRLKKEREYFSKTVEHVHHPKLRINRRAFGHLMYFFVGIILLILSSYAVVWAGQNLVNRTIFSALSFGIIFLALGTALPELAFGVRARLARHGSMTVGNSLGSIAFNSTLIVGIVSLVKPIEITVSLNLLAVAFFLFLALLFFNIFVFSRAFISRKEGVILLAVYIAFLLFEYLEYFTGII